MRTFRSILLVLDKKDDGKAVLEWLSPLAKDHETRLTVVVGVPFLEITRQVLRDGHDHQIVPAAGNGGVRERLLGSPAVHLMRACPCPIWVLRSGRSQPHGGILAALDAENEENEDLNRKILHFAYCLALWENGEIHVLHPRPTGAENCHRDQKGLDVRRAEYGPVSRTMHFYYLRGAAASLICRLARDRQVDVIVMGTAGRPGAGECVPGNLAETVLHRVDCSVLSVNPDRFVSPVTV
jgi:universal stress protein E